jgi:hypothetical protein
MEGQSELRLQSKNGEHQFSVYVRDDGRLAAVPYHKNTAGEWVAGPNDKVIVAWSADNRVW